MNKNPALLPIFTLALACCIYLPAQAESSSSAQPHGVRTKQADTPRHRYVYYPVQQIYYSQVSQTWFWLHAGKWQVGVHLPKHITIDANSVGVPVMLQSSRPYVQHAYVEQHFGKPWREQHAEGRDTQSLQTAWQGKANQLHE